MLGIANTSLAQAVMGATPEFVVDCESTAPIFFTDNNGGSMLASDPYTDNGVEQIILCPSDPTQAVHVEFIVFDLQTNSNVNNQDYLNIYDGNSTADLQWAGQPNSTGNFWEGGTITASLNNPSGCLTFVLDNNGLANMTAEGWAAQLTCKPPCSVPLAEIDLVSPAAFDGNPNSVGMCPDEPLTLSAAASVPNGFPISEVVFNWGDGNTEAIPFASASNAQHSYTDPGEYIVTAQVVDENSCTSVNLQPIQVLVSTIPIFNAQVTSPMCTGVPGFLNGDPVQSVSWTALPPLAESDTADLPDNLGIPFTSELTVDFFDDGQILENCDDLELITANIEHTWVGDLNMSVICPNGTEVLLMENNQGLPDSLGCLADDYDGNDLGIADVEGFDYSWNMDADVVLDSIVDPTFFDALPAGVYLPCGDLCDFEGCPLNGIWQFVIEDTWGGDNGTLYNWNIDFNPDIVPDVTTFTPVIGLESDSSFWAVDLSDAEVVGLDEDANEVDLLYSTAGTYNYDFVVTNNFGCQWDTTVQVVVIDNPGTSLSTGPDQTYCSVPVTLSAGLSSEGGSDCSADAGTEEICLGNDEFQTFTYCPDNPGDGTVMTLNFTGGFLETCCDFLTVYDGADNTAPIVTTTNGDFTGVSFTATNPDGCITIELTSDGSVGCGSGSFDPLQFCVTCGGPDICAYDWEWTPADYLDNPFSPQPTVTDFDGAPVEYTVSVEPVGLDNCAATGTVLVEPAFEFSASYTDPSCQITDGTIEVDLLTAFGDVQGPFTAEILKEDPITGNFSQIANTTWVDNSTFGKYDLDAGTYSVVVENDEGCFYVQNFVLDPPPPLTLIVPPVQTICLGAAAVMEVESPQDDNFSFTYVWDNGLPNGPVQQVSPNTSTVYAVQGFDPAGCPTPVYNVGVNVLDALSADLTATDFLCSGQEAELDASASNGGSGTGYTYVWSFEGNTLNEDAPEVTLIPPSSGTYCVTVDDDCATPPSTACAEVVLETPVPIAFSDDTTESCGTGDFFFTNETESSLIVASTWAFGDNTFSGESNTFKTFNSPGFYDVALTVTSLAGGCDYTLVKEAYINVYPNPDVGFLPTPQPTRAPDTEITFAGQSEANVVEWHWTFNSIDPLGESFEQNPTFQFPPGQGGNYPVKLEVTDANGCTNEVTRLIEIKDMFNLFIPNSFTPNNDGYNDAFFVQGTDIDPEDFKLEIWNRWGALVWSTTDPTDAWYGQVEEEGQHYVPNGSYPYRVEVHSIEDEGLSKEVFGIVTIIR